MKKYFVAGILSLFVLACGDVDNNKKNYLEKVAGMWDASIFTQNGDEDEMYLYIESDGTYTRYDYRGDLDYNREDCYYKATATLVDVGNNNFEIVTENDTTIKVQISKSGGNLVMTYESAVYIYPPSLLLETDFTPLCNSDE